MALRWHRVLALLLAGALLWGCDSKQAIPSAPPAAPPARGAGSDITYRTADGWTIHGDYYPVPNATRAVLLLHQRGGSAADWGPLRPALAQAGIAALAIDQRGAGRSTGPQSGEDAPWETSGDIAGAVRWLGERQHIPPAHVGLAGASYGANNALLYAASAQPPPPAVALLSPGTDYHGLRIEPAARAYHGAILVLAAKGDSITGGGPELLRRVAPSATQALYEGGAHGTELFGANPDSVQRLAAFLKEKL